MKQMNALAVVARLAGAAKANGKPGVAILIAMLGGYFVGCTTTDDAIYVEGKDCAALNITVESQRTEPKGPGMEALVAPPG